MRMFVALLPPPDVLEHLEEFLAVRREAGPEWRWALPEQWHLTLAFMPSVADRHIDDLSDRLEQASARRTAFPLALAGGGAFPDPARAKVLFARVETEDEELRRLATGVRAAAGKAGAGPDGGPFHPHVTLARTGRPLQATRWLRVLDAYRGKPWVAQDVALVSSHLGEGPRRRPRHELVETFPLGGGKAR